jgi:hypothetical protein
VNFSPFALAQWIHLIYRTTTKATKGIKTLQEFGNLIFVEVDQLLSASGHVRPQSNKFGLE